MRLAIGGPTRDTGPVSFAVDLAQLYAYTREHGPWDIVTLGYIESTYIHVGREYFLASCLRQGATHVLWIDTDMGFPMETAVRLAMHEVPIVGVNYPTRDVSHQPTARRGRTRIETGPESTGLEVVDGMGFGVVLMRTDFLTPLRRPWFRHGLNAEGGDIGEDLVFCQALTAAGIPIYIDHDLSKEVAHVGQSRHRTTDRQAAVPDQWRDRADAVSSGCAADAGGNDSARVRGGA